MTAPATFYEAIKFDEKNAWQGKKDLTKGKEGEKFSQIFNQMKSPHQQKTQNILHHISNSYEEFTPSQRRVAQYIYNNANEALLLNSFQIAKTANVSEATVTRFVSNLGFSGFSEFKREIARQVLENFSTTKRLAESAENLQGRGNVFSGILKGDIENIRTLTAKISNQLPRRKRMGY